MELDSTINDTNMIGSADRQLYERHRKRIQKNGFLRRIYQGWYETVQQNIPTGPGEILELGAGSGFLREVIPQVVSSDVVHLAGLSLVLDGQHLPFKADSLKAVLMIDVLHHLPEPEVFFREAARTVEPGGVIIMIEPWVSAWSRLIYKNFHHEPYDQDAASWRIPVSGPMAGANIALPWIIFQRDRERFLREFPEWGISAIVPETPFRYLLSGGVRCSSLLPASSEPIFRGLENCLSAWMSSLAMFACIVLHRTDSRI